MTGRNIQPTYVDALGRRHRAPRRSLEALRAAYLAKAPSRTAEDPHRPLIVGEGERRLVGPAELVTEDGASITIDDRLPGDLPCGYHRLRKRKSRDERRLIVAPRACYLPDDYRAWGWAIQLYAARSRKSWGIGDLADLRALGRWARADGASIALVNPLSSATPVLPQQPSPYFPSSRRFRNPLYLHVEEMDGAREAGLERLGAAARALNHDRLIDRDRVYTLKMAAFEKVWRIVRHRRDPGFDRYVADVGPSLLEYATFCALADQFRSGWQSWPSRYRRPSSAAVRQVVDDRQLGDRVSFHAWLQYQLDRQLARAAAAIPVMQDLPIGFDPDGADAWAFQDVLAGDVTVGAPPDEFNTNGQNWGLPPFVPDALARAGYEPFIQTIRACLRHAGGLRIDHVMGLFRLFWIPGGTTPRDGAYVLNPADDFLAIVALESQRARAVIVGEDLGTVDEGFRRTLMERCVLSYRLLWFEKDHPRRFPRQALAAATTHDLPTIAGLWTGSDLDIQKRLHLSPNETGTRDIHRRLARLAKASRRTRVERVIAAAYAGLATAPSRIVTATLDDAMAVEERPNMPATSDEWPNWSIALPRPIETLKRNTLATTIARGFSRRRR